MHHQNLNEKWDNGVMTMGSAIINGRAWFKIWRSFCIEWVCFKWEGLRFSFDTNWSEGEVTFGLSLLFFTLYLVISGIKFATFMRFLPHREVDLSWKKPPTKEIWPDDREICIYTHDWALWWSLWNPTHEWSSKTPRWRHGSFHLKDFLLGQMKHNPEILEGPKDILIPMPEGCYPGKLKVERRTWTRPRWPWWPLKIVRVSRDIEVEQGIPYSGKGENSWDCGEDGLCGAAFAVETDEEAIGRFAGSVMKTRKRRGDKPDYGKGATLVTEAAHVE